MRRVLVTGGSGSFGKAFVRKLLDTSPPERLVIFSRGEHRQEEMERELGPHPSLRFFIGDVRDERRLEMAMQGIDTVVHAAALKIIPTAEYNPFECVQTNVIGAQNVVKAAIFAGVKKVLALSTDKAVNPSNLYGATKLCAERIFVAANKLAAGKTQFSLVRYGNVINSNGSVVKLFLNLLRGGANSLPITDKRMTRFWITLEQGAEFVLQCEQMMTGGEIFVPKIPSMSVVDLARHLAPKIPHRVVGIRPGEKLHEVLITEHESATTIDVGAHYIIQPAWNYDAGWHNSSRGRYHCGVPPGFRYSSDANEVKLNPSVLRELL